MEPAHQNPRSLSGDSHMQSRLGTIVVIVQVRTCNTFESELLLSTSNSKGGLRVKLSVFRKSIYRLREWVGVEEDGGFLNSHQSGLDQEKVWWGS